MEINGIGRNHPANPAGKDAASTSLATGAAVQQDHDANPAYEEYDRLVHGLAKFTESTQKADNEAKARAKQKLKDAQEQLKFLQRWGMDPDVIARQAAQLGVVVAAAAREFAQALVGGSATPGAALALPAAGDATSAETQQPDSSIGNAGDKAEEPNSTSQAEQAYRDVMDDAAPTQTSHLSADDIRTATEFSTIARQIKALLEEAARNLRERSNLAAMPGTQNLDAIITAMTNVVAATPSATITI